MEEYESHIKGILAVNEVPSGQTWNKEKTLLYFSRNRSHAFIRNLLGVKSTGNFDKNLGSRSRAQIQNSKEIMVVFFVSG